ncbi:hypothetical protein ACIBIZ_23655 [Nonomuraea spiralis]|uniref:Uncharacterized protein n=1 Tax=Nonomuraea spiralis TaxID=46182 RepID=A0ABV5IEU0_9ACTN|nr:MULTISPECIES: hypothetical protein [Nonomuraea]RSN10261.1 hypothetical protein DMB42_15060 [Nonomuraea sp. WAC 01424]GGS70280.1 hypothetical protein GCM10010176_011150 [Nonomuraea spiralis]
MRQAHAEDARTEARRIVRNLLGDERPTAETLIGDVRPVLGDERTDRALGLALGASLTRRSAELAAIAALLVGTRELGADWWTRPRGGKLPPPDEVLRTAVAIEPWTDLTALEMLAAWSADDAADQLWGRPAAQVDLNSWQAEDRFDLPPDVKPGQRLVVHFDAGGRLDAVVARRPDEALGSNLDFQSLRYSRPAEAQWSWGVAAGLGPHRLPGERPDPYAREIPAAAAGILRAWAVRHGVTREELGERWATVGDVVAAIERADWMWRSGEWFGWWRGASALVDDSAYLPYRLEELAAG